VKFAFIAANEVAFAVAPMCRVLGVSPSGYYAWKKRPAPKRLVEDVRLAEEVAQAHAASRGIYGSPRLHRELRAKGIRTSRKRIERLMRQRGLRGRQKRRFVRTTDSRHDRPVAPNRLQRNFATDRPNQAWVGDVTFIHTADGWLYLAVLIDLFSRRVVGWSTSESNDRALALAALGQALKGRRPRRGLLQHTDRGSPYASEDYTAAIAAHGLVASMSRTGDCYDNAVAECFFASLKAEWVDHESYSTRTEAHLSIAQYIDGFYNPTRRHSYLDYLSPIEFELKARVAALAA
jgi:transposase InsO family protein